MAEKIPENIKAFLAWVVSVALIVTLAAPIVTLVAML